MRITAESHSFFAFVLGDVLGNKKASGVRRLSISPRLNAQR